MWENAFFFLLIQIDNILAITNQGYLNSGVLINLVLHCTEEYTGAEESGNSAMLAAFRNYKVLLKLARPEVATLSSQNVIFFFTGVIKLKKNVLAFGDFKG